MAMNWPRWIKREWHRVASATPVGVPSSPLREPSFEDVEAVYGYWWRAAIDSGRSVDIALNSLDSRAYNMARVVWLHGALAGNRDENPTAGWRLNSSRRRNFDRFSFTLVPLARTVGLNVRVSRAIHGDASWWVVRVKWLEGQVGHLVLTGNVGAPAATGAAAVAPRTVAENAVAGTVGPATVLDWTNITYGVEIECIRPTNISMAEFARLISEAGVPCNAEHYNHHVSRAWKIVTDGSLSDRNGIGMEVVSPILRGEADFEQIRKVSEVLIGANRNRPVCRINRTCGLHCHNGLPRREHNLPKNIFRLYHHFESVFDSLQPESRRGNANGYARPTTYTARMNEATTLDQLRTAYGYDRYRKVNMESIWRHGTIEYRQHAGTVEAEKIIEWVKLVLKLTAVANSVPPLPEGPATLDGLMTLVGADEASKAYWRDRQAYLALPTDGRGRRRRVEAEAA